MKKMMKVRKCIFVEKMCEVKYYIMAEPATDPHFAPEPPYVLQNKYFDTKTEAELFLKEWESTHGYFFGNMQICEQVTELEEG